MSSQITVPVKGMHCASCAVNIERKLKTLPGVESCEVNYGNDKAKIVYDEAAVSVEQMSKEIEHLGYSLESQGKQMAHAAKGNHAGHGGHQHSTGADGDKHGSHQMENNDSQHMDSGMGDGTHDGVDHSEHLGLGQTKDYKLAELAEFRLKSLIVVPLAITMFVLMGWDILAQAGTVPMLPINMETLNTILLIVSTPVMFWAGSIFIQGAIRFVRYRAANMDTLVGIGTLTAYTYSTLVTLFPGIAMALNTDHTYFDVTIVVIGFVLLGKYLETSSKLKTGAALEKLVGLQAKTALVKRGDEFVEIDLSEVIAGDRILVKPGQKIPVDGNVLEGSSYVDESMVTGESIPTEKVAGSAVIGGTINKSGSFEFEATKVGSQTLLAQIIALVEEAQGSRAPIQKLADQVSGVFVPVVLIIAALTLLIWLTLGTAALGFSTALSLGILCFVGVLVIACPCALGLATPTAIIVSTGVAAAQGILVKDAEHLETLHKAQILVFDKTGTLTKGKPEVTDVVMLGKMPEAELLLAVAAIEAKSEHPLAEAIVAKVKDSQLPTVTGFDSIQGQGVKAQAGGRDYLIGNLRLMTDYKVSGLEAETFLSQSSLLAKQGKTPVFAAADGKIEAIIGIADTLKEETKPTIAALKKLGLKLVMLTGDNQQTATAIAAQIGITYFRAEVLPNDKVNVIKELQKQGIVAMLGDGVNDAPALAQANVGVAMGTGTDIAIDSAGIILLKGDLSKLLKAINLSRRTMNTIKQNLFWAFFYNVASIPVAAGILYPFFGILLSPAVAGVAMGLSSVSVVFNSLRLRR